MPRYFLLLILMRACARAMPRDIAAADVLTLARRFARSRSRGIPLLIFLRYYCHYCRHISITLH